MMATEEAFLIPTTWGWALAGVVLQPGDRRPGGFEAVYRTIARSGVGTALGTRNTYKKLFSRSAPPTDGTDIARAAVLLLAVSESPSDPKWGLDLTKLPPIFGTLRRLRDLLRTGNGPHGNGPVNGESGFACTSWGTPATVFTLRQPAAA